MAAMPRPANANVAGSGTALTTPNGTKDEAVKVDTVAMLLAPVA